VYTSNTNSDVLYWSDYTEGKTKQKYSWQQSFFITPYEAAQK